MDNQKRDDLLWELARKRASFKWNLASYIIVNTFLVMLWYLSDNSYDNFWPIWPIMGWGIGLAFHYFGAYHGNDIFSVEKEYERLKRQQSQL